LIRIHWILVETEVQGSKSKRNWSKKNCYGQFPTDFRWYRGVCGKIHQKMSEPPMDRGRPWFTRL